jgi:hypothetical protein
MTEFVPALDLSESFFREAVRPVLDSSFPGLLHSAGLLGTGSEVLEYDTARSADHDWGSRVLLFVEEDCGVEIGDALGDTFLGHPVLGVRVLSIREFFLETLGVDPAGPIGPTDWVTFSEQSLLEVTRGRSFMMVSVRSSRHGSGFPAIRKMSGATSSRPSGGGFHRTSTWWDGPRKSVTRSARGSSRRGSCAT